MLQIEVGVVVEGGEEGKMQAKASRAMIMSKNPPSVIRKTRKCRSIVFMSSPIEEISKRSERPAMRSQEVEP
jgi:hypothetical protein